MLKGREKSSLCAAFIWTNMCWWPTEYISMTKRNISLQKNTKFLSNYCSVFKTILSSYGLWINREIKVTAWMWWCLWTESELLEPRVSNTEVVKHAVSLVTARLLLRQALPRSQHLQSLQSPTIGRDALSHNPGDHVNAACVLLSHCVTCGVEDCPPPSTTATNTYHHW